MTISVEAKVSDNYRGFGAMGPAVTFHNFDALIWGPKI